MTTTINADDFLVREAVDKFLEVLGCTGRYDLGLVETDAQAYALADRVLADTRILLAAAIRRDALLLAADCAEGVASLDA